MRLFHRMIRMEKYASEVLNSLESRDAHNATHLTLSSPIAKQSFQAHLRHLISRQQQANSKSIWIHLNKDNLNLLPSAIDLKFKIHHGKDDSIILYRWLSELQDLVPAFSRFYVASGAVVIQNSKVLVVQERNGARKNDWGVPGGLCELNEPIADACVRELQEETNLKGKYKYVLFFRELENTLHGATDLYFANLVQLPAGEQSNLKLCERELLGHQWLPLGEINSFFNTHQIKGTQKHLLAYLSELHQKKFQFYKEMPNTTHEHISTVRGGQKYFKEHRLVP